MEKTVLLAVAAGFCTATSSVCQRLGARSLEGMTGFDFKILFRLARRPIWLLGVLSMILGFVFQISALRSGDLALVQPILAIELLFVFSYMSMINLRAVRKRDWLAASAMTAGLGLFLFLALPSGGHRHAPGSSWWFAGLAIVVVLLGCIGFAFGWTGHVRPSPTRRASALGVATGISWGFLAGVIKELSSHLGGGIGAVVSNWSLYVLIGAGLGTMLLASHALSAGPLAASQPGFTIADPVVASLLGLYLFDEHIRVFVVDLAGEAVALALLITGIVVLSHSQLVDPREIPGGRRESLGSRPSLQHRPSRVAPDANAEGIISQSGRKATGKDPGS